MRGFLRGLISAAGAAAAASVAGGTADAVPVRISDVAAPLVSAPSKASCFICRPTHPKLLQ